MIQVHPQLEEGVTGHGVLPNQQMFKTKRRVFTPTFERCKRFLAHEADCPKKSFAARSAWAARARRCDAASVVPARCASAAVVRRGRVPSRPIVRGGVAA